MSTSIPIAIPKVTAEQVAQFRAQANVYLAAMQAPDYLSEAAEHLFTAMDRWVKEQEAVKSASIQGEKV